MVIASANVVPLLHSVMSSHNASDSEAPSESIILNNLTKHEQLQMKKHLGRQITRAQDTSKPRISTVQQISINWSCASAQILPVGLQPRERLRNGKPPDYRAKDHKRLRPNGWSKNFKFVLAKLSHVTAGDQETAFRLLQQQVRRRQEEGTHGDWYAREVLTSDLRKVLQELRRLRGMGRYKGTGAGKRSDRTKAWVRTEAGESFDEGGDGH